MILRKNLNLCCRLWLGIDPGGREDFTKIARAGGHSL